MNSIGIGDYYDPSKKRESRAVQLGSRNQDDSTIDKINETIEDIKKSCIGKEKSPECACFYNSLASNQLYFEALTVCKNINERNRFKTETYTRLMKEYNSREAQLKNLRIRYVFRDDQCKGNLDNGVQLANDYLLRQPEPFIASTFIDGMSFEKIDSAVIIPSKDLDFPILYTNEKIKNRLILPGTTVNVVPLNGCVVDKDTYQTQDFKSRCDSLLNLSPSFIKSELDRQTAKILKDLEVLMPSSFTPNVVPQILPCQALPSIHISNCCVNSINLDNAILNNANQSCEQKTEINIKPNDTPTKPNDTPTKPNDTPTKPDTKKHIQTVIIISSVVLLFLISLLLFFLL